MRTLAPNIFQQWTPARFAAVAQSVNDRAAVCDGLIESRVEGQPYVGLNAVVLTPAERDEIARLTNLFGRIMAKALEQIVKDLRFTIYDLREKWVSGSRGQVSGSGELKPQTSNLKPQTLGWPKHLEYALASEPVNRYLTTLGRFDFVQDTAGKWHLLEFNSDTPSGAQEITQVETRLYGILKRFGKLARLNPAIGEAMIAALKDEALVPPTPPATPELYGPRRLPRVGFLVRGRHLTDLAQVLYYANGLEAAGLECVVGDLNNLSLINNQIYLLGQPINALYRLFPVEYLSQEPLFAAYLQANLVGAFKCLNNLRGFFAQSKAIMAWVWQMRESPLFDPEEQAAIAEHLPETHLVSEVPPDFDYSSYIVKEFYGREGAEVYNGATMSEDDWEECRKWRTFVAQKRIDIAPQPHAWLNAHGAVEQGEVFPCVGGFLVGGQWAGCYTRVGGRITDSTAQFVPTLVEF